MCVFFGEVDVRDAILELPTDHEPLVRVFYWLNKRAKVQNNLYRKEFDLITCLKIIDVNNNPLSKRKETTRNGRLCGTFPERRYEPINLFFYIAR